MLERLKHFLGDDFQSAKGSEVRFCCPYCIGKGKGEDTKHHLYVNKNNGLFFCQRCETKGHVSFIDKGFKDPEFGRNEDGGRRSRFDALKDYFSPRVMQNNAPVVSADFPEDYIPIMNHPSSEAVSYLESRGIPFETAIQRGLGFGSTRNRGRIIFPVFDPENKSKCVFWVARSYSNRKHVKPCSCFLCKYRYTNAPDVMRRHFIYGLSFCRGKTVCLTEGPISALNAGPNAVATFGKYVTEEQLSILSDRFDIIQVAQDPDAFIRSVKLMKELLGMGLTVQWVPMPIGKDPADLGIEEMIDRRASAVNITRTRLIEVLLRGFAGVE